MIVTVDEIKTHLRIEHDEEDGYLSALITAATATAEDFCRRSFSEDMLEPVRLAIYGMPWTRGAGSSGCAACSTGETTA